MTPKQFKGIRNKLEMTQVEFAAELAVSRRAIQMWEAGDSEIPRTVAYASYWVLFKQTAGYKKVAALFRQWQK